MKKKEETNVEGKPLRVHELDVQALARYLNENKVRTSQGKIIQPLHDGHIEVVSDPGRFKVLACGRRWGKSLVTVLMALSVLMQPSRRVWIIAPDYSLCEKVFRELYSILVHQLKIITPGKQGRARNQKGDYYLETPWGSVLEAKSLENPDSLAGEANDLVIIDEAALNSNIYDIWTQMIRPTLADKSGSAFFISTPRGKGQFYKLFLQGQLGKRQREGKTKIEKDLETGLLKDYSDWSSFQKTSYDNPLLAATPEQSRLEVDAAYREAVLAGKIVKFKQEWLADFESVEDTCFPGFYVEPTDNTLQANVIDYNWHPEEGPIFAACDFNYARPASTIFAQVNKYGDVVIFGEKFTPKTSTYNQAQQILDKEEELNIAAVDIWLREGKSKYEFRRIKFESIVADVSGKQQQLNGRTAWDDMASVLGRQPSGIAQKREVGCNMIRQWLRYPLTNQQGAPVMDEKGQPTTAPKLFISRECVNLIYALSSAKFKKGTSGNLKEDYQETPEGYEGLLDALRYLLVTLFHPSGSYFSVFKGVM